MRQSNRKRERVISHEASFLSAQVSYGDHAPMVHRNGFLQGQLGRVLPVAMATSRRRVEFERRVLTQHSQISQDCPQSEDSQVRGHLTVVISLYIT